MILAALTVIANIGSASILPCTSDTAANYVANFQGINNACIVGDKLFYNFNILTTSHLATGPTNAQITIVGDPSNPYEPGLLFSSNGWSVSGTATTSAIKIDTNITFDVSVVGDLLLMIDTSLSFDQTNHSTGGGSSDIAELVTLPSGGVLIGVDSNNGPFTTVLHFPPVSHITVNKDLIVQISPGTTGTASITAFREGFSEVPEPFTATLFGTGLAGLAFFRRRR
jgi:hypothetical protein